MNCPDEEQIIAFAIDPLKEQNAEMGLHIYECADCAAILSDAIEMFSCTDKISVMPEDVEFAMTALKIYRDKETFFRKAELFLEKVRSITSQESLAILPSARPVFCGRSAIQENTFQLFFESDAENTSPDYWTANVIIPEQLKTGAEIAVYCKDRRKLNIMFGTVRLFGSLLNVCNGYGKLDFSLLKNNLRDPLVYFEFSDGRKISGHLNFNSSTGGI